MKLISDDQRTNGIMAIPAKCKLCSMWLLHTVHTKYGHRFVCVSHTDKELEDYEYSCKNMEPWLRV